MFNKAAENGYEQSYSHIGRYYRDGRIIKIDYENALFWFEKAIASQILMCEEKHFMTME